VHAFCIASCRERARVRTGSSKQRRGKAVVGVTLQ
jgi:hypothetical protein